METLRKQLNAECSYRMKDETMDGFLGLMTEMKFKRNQPLCDYNKFNDNVYIIKEGIVRIAYWDGFNERTYAFATSGTVVLSYYSFSLGIPAFSKLEACCDSVVMKVTKAQFVEFVKQSHDFAQWMMYLSMAEVTILERKLEIINGDAKERFEALLLNRPEIIKNVSSKILASYIGVTPIYLCKLKRDFAQKSNK